MLEKKDRERCFSSFKKGKTMAAQWNKETQQWETYSTLTGGMVPTGSGRNAWKCECGIIRRGDETASEEIQHDIMYHSACGYCKCDPCQCDGHGNWRS